MGWQTRGGRSYYYHPRRSGGRVVNAYIGRGEVAELFAAQVEARRVEEREAGEEIREARARLGPVERLSNRLDDGSALLLEATLRAEGFYRHSRKWRGPRHVR
jgi:hypothetical protein